MESANTVFSKTVPKMLTYCRKYHLAEGRVHIKEKGTCEVVAGELAKVDLIKAISKWTRKEVDIRYDKTNRKQKREMKSMFNQKTLPMIVVPSQGHAGNLLKRNAKQADLRFRAKQQVASIITSIDMNGQMLRGLRKFHINMWTLYWHLVLLRPFYT